MIDLILLFKSLLVKDTGIIGVWVFDTDNTVAPSVFNDSIALAKEYLLRLHSIEFLQLCFYVSQLSPSLSRSAEIP